MNTTLMARVLMPLDAHGGWPRSHGADPGQRSLPRPTLHALVALVLALHVLGAWALLRAEPVRQAAAEHAPMFVHWLTPTSPTVALPSPAAPSPVPASRAPAALPSLHGTPPTATAEPQTFNAPATVDTPSPAPAAPAAAKAAPHAPPPAQPAAASAPAVAPAPRALPPTAVRYVVAPAPVYPATSRRLGESGEVRVRVEIDTEGHAQQLRVQQSSGWPRLDEAALAAVRAARFAPYAEGGVPLAVWTVVPIVFELQD